MKKTFDEAEIGKRLKDYIVTKRHFRDFDITREKVSAETGIPKAYISSVMKSLFGCNFYDFVNRHRAYQAHRIIHSLTHRHSTLEEIALQCGFSCRMTFHRSYLKVYGITPGDDRKACLEERELTGID